MLIRTLNTHIEGKGKQRVSSRVRVDATAARSLHTNNIDDLVRRAHVEVGKSLVDQLRHPASKISVCAGRVSRRSVLFRSVWMSRRCARIWTCVDTRGCGRGEDKEDERVDARARGGTRARDKRTSVAEHFGSCLGGLGRLRAVPSTHVLAAVFLFVSTRDDVSFGFLCTSDVIL